MVLLALVSENGVMYIPQKAIVWNPEPSLDKLLKVILMACGCTSSTFVRTHSSDVTMSYVTEPVNRVDKRVHTSLPISYDNDILRGLSPRLEVSIGSLQHMFPSSLWRSDGGSPAICIPDDLYAVPEKVVPIKGNGVVVRRPKMPRLATPIRVTVIDVPGVVTPSGGVTRTSTSLTHVDSVKLRDGDTVIDSRGVEWFFQDGALRDRVKIVLPSRSLRVTKRLIEPRLIGSERPHKYRPNTNTELVILWSEAHGTGKSVFRAKSKGADKQWGFILENDIPTVTHSQSICHDAGGFPNDIADATSCVQAGGTWDRPCKYDVECPVYDERRGLGGCHRGFCEMPVGVDRKSYRTHGGVKRMARHGCDPESKDYPMCSDQPKRNARFPEKSIFSNVS